jgi:hypothetical protein
MNTTEPPRPPLDGPTANDEDLDRALFGPCDDDQGSGNGGES